MGAFALAGGTLIEPGREDRGWWAAYIAQLTRYGGWSMVFLGLILIGGGIAFLSARRGR